MTNLRRLALATALFGTLAMPAFAQGSTAGSAAAPAIHGTAKAKAAPIHRVATTETKKPDAMKPDPMKQNTAKPAVVPTAKPVVTTDTAKPAPVKPN